MMGQSGGISTSSGRRTKQGGNFPKWFIYPFFMFHMLMFGTSGFLLAYAGATPDVTFLYMHGGIAIAVYLVFYLVIFGVDEVKWMFINAALGLYGISVEIDWLLSLFGKHVADYPYYIHAIPFLYYVLYTFLLRQLVLDVTRSRQSERRMKFVESFYIVASVVIYTLVYLKSR